MAVPSYCQWATPILLFVLIIVSPLASPDLWSRLRILYGKPEWPVDNTAIQHALEPTTCHSDSLNVHIADGGGNPEEMTAAYRTLNECHNLRSLEVEIAQGGCLVSLNDQRAFIFSKDAWFTNLTLLRLSQYDWNFRQRSSFGPYSYKQLSAELWLKAMDWTKLERLDIDLPSKIFLDLFQKQLTGLQSLTFRPAWGYWGDEETLCGFDPETLALRDLYTSFIANLPPLHELRISGTGEVLNLKPILLKHGNTLRTLALHEHERDCASASSNNTSTRPTLSIKEMNQINMMAPHLETLTLDLSRTPQGGWPMDALEVLSTYDNLQDLTLYFELDDYSRMRDGDHCFNDWNPCRYPTIMEPLVNRNATGGLFGTLRHGQKSKKLQSLTLIAGDYGRRIGGGLRLPDLNLNQPRICRCRLQKDNAKTCGCRQRTHLYGPDIDFD